MHNFDLCPPHEIGITLVHLPHFNLQKMEIPQLSRLIIIMIIIMGIAITLKFTGKLQNLSETSWFDKCDFR